MLFKISVISSVWLLATTALARPLLVDRQTCPGPTQTTTTRYIATEYTTTTLATTTVTNGISYLGSVTSTQSLTEIRRITTQKTVYSPSVTTIPITTVSTTITGPTTTLVWYTTTSTVVLPGTPPASLCLTKTCTKTISSTYTYIWTNQLWYDTTWATTVGHVYTTTRVILTTTTRTVTTPGSTSALTTVVATGTIWPVAITDTTVYTTVYATPAPTYCG
ncbi:hypothetical protein ABW19_dt0201673 [Dactylella cylindrospora]|nr:hypothetical protein ABW19_dt0201673 [Dactylella cylindrospora]